MDEILRQILSELKGQDQRLGRLEQGQDTLRQGQESLRQGQEAQGQRLERLEKSQEAQGRELKELRQGQEAQGRELQALRSETARLDQGQRRLELRLEHEVIEKVKVLFDAHSLYLDYFESIRDSQARIEEKLDRQGERLDRHEQEILALKGRRR